MLLLSKISYSNCVITRTVLQVWDVEYSPADVVCRMCGGPLGNAVKNPGTKGKAWLLNKCGLQEASIRVKICSNLKCKTRHGFLDWKSGEMQGMIVAFC